MRDGQSFRPIFLNFQNIGFFSGGTSPFLRRLWVLLLVGYCNGSCFHLSSHTLFCVTPCATISPSYSSQSGNTRFRPYATCFSQHLPLSLGPTYICIHTPITYRTYLFTHLYSKIPGPPHLPTNSDFLMADHLIRRRKLFNTHLCILYLVDKYLTFCASVFFYIPFRGIHSSVRHGFIEILCFTLFCFPALLIWCVASVAQPEATEWLCSCYTQRPLAWPRIAVDYLSELLLLLTPDP